MCVSFTDRPAVCIKCELINHLTDELTFLTSSAIFPMLAASWLVRSVLRVMFRALSLSSVTSCSSLWSFWVALFSFNSASAVSDSTWMQYGQMKCYLHVSDVSEVNVLNYGSVLTEDSRLLVFWMSVAACRMALLAAVWALWASSSARFTFSAESFTSAASSLTSTGSHISSVHYRTF